LLDIVLGYGSHPDMAGEIIDAIGRAKARTDKDPVVAACLCGTQDDPQNYDQQKAKLEEIGVIVFPTNVAMVKFAARCLERK
jgi:FdrA protein